MSCGERSCKHFAEDCPKDCDTFDCTVDCKHYEWDGETEPDSVTMQDFIKND